MTTQPNSPTHSAEAQAHSPAPPAGPRLGDWISRLQTGQPQERAEAHQTLRNFVHHNPANPVGQLGLGIAEALQGRFNEAAVHFTQAVQLDPKFASAWSNLGNIHKLKGRLKDAAKAYRKAIALQPDLPDAHYNLALALEAQGLPTKAEESLRRALLFRPGYPEVHNNLGHLLLKAGKLEQAASHFRQALVFNPHLRPARNNLIMALYRLGKGPEAQVEVDGLLAQNPNDTQVLRLQAAALAQQGRLEDASAINDRLLTLEPEAVDLQLNLGEMLLQRNDHAGALAHYRELLAKGAAPPVVAMGAMGNVLHAKGNFTEARTLYQQALMLDPKRPHLMLGLARTLMDAGETRQGLEVLKRAVQLLPQAADVHSLYLLAMRADGHCSPQDRHAEAAHWLTAHARTAAHLPRLTRKTTDPLHLGLLVGDTEQGLAGPALVALLPQLAPDKFNITVYHAGRAGPTAAALQGAVAHWRPVAALGSSDITEQMRQDGLDVLIDTIGHESGSRLQALSERVAPVQLGWLGDFDHCGLPAFDGLLQDAVLQGELPVPTASLPGTPAPSHWLTLPALPAAALWQPPPQAPEPGPLPLLANGFITFGVCAPTKHIQPPALDAWARVLQALPQARLLVLTQTADDDQATRTRLQRLLLLRDIEPERVEVLAKQSMPDRLLSMARMDVVVDTFPAPMGLDALDALWMGLPVLTLQGQEPWQRTTESALAQAGLSHWAVADANELVARTTALAEHKAQAELAELRLSLRERLRSAPLMDAKGFAQAFETAVVQAAQRQVA